MWLCSTAYGPVLAETDLSIGNPGVTCRQVLPDTPVAVTRHLYTTAVRYLLELLA